MSLSEEHITAIKNFISRKGIKYVDVQMEIIDHVASSIEEKMAADPNLSFETALKQTHSSFGIFGFSGMEDAIVNGLAKKYSILFWKKFGSFFGPKYILLVLLAGFLTYKLEVLMGDYQNLLTIFLLVTITLVVILAVLGLKYKAYHKLLVYRTSVSYVMFIGSFLQIFNLLVNKTSEAVIFGVNRNLLFGAIVLVVFVLYVVSAIKIALVGIKESKLLLDKYQLFES